MIDPTIRHQIYLQRYSAGEAKKASALLRQLAIDLRAKIASQDATAFELHRLSVLEREIASMIQSSVGQVQAGLDESMKELAGYEADFTKKMLTGAVTVEVAGVTPEMVMAAVSNAPMYLTSGDVVRSVTPLEAFAEFAGRQAKIVQGTVSSGLVMGRTTQQIARDVADLVKGRTVREAQTMAHTILSHASAQAQAAVWEENREIFSGYRWSATLDGRTSMLCLSRDGVVYPEGKVPPRPAHWNCRSVIIPVVKESLRIPGMKMERASMDGPVDAKTTYQTWLKGQSAGFQDDVLGPTRGKLFRDGKVSLDKFTDDKGRTLTLAELKKKEGLTWD